MVLSDAAGKECKGGVLEMIHRRNDGLKWYEKKKKEFESRARGEGRGAITLSETVTISDCPWALHRNHNKYVCKW
jgi:hypothetical protein